MRELLPVIDNLERALGSDVSTSPEQLRQGVQMTLQQLTQLLRRHGIETEESLGKPFDPHYHEAVRAFNCCQFQRYLRIRADRAEINANVAMLFANGVCERDLSTFRRLSDTSNLIWVLANCPTLFPFLVARLLPNPRAGYEEQFRRDLDHVANPSPFNRGPLLHVLPSCRLKLG